MNKSGSEQVKQNLANEANNQFDHCLEMSPCLGICKIMEYFTANANIAVNSLIQEFCSAYTKPNKSAKNASSRIQKLVKILVKKNKKPIKSINSIYYFK